MASVLERGTTIIAWSAVWKCSGEERMDVRQRSRVWGVFSSGKVKVHIFQPNILDSKYVTFRLLS